MSATTLTEPPPRRAFFADLGVGYKISAVVAVGVLVSVIAGVLATRALSRSANSAQELYRSNLASESALAELETLSVSTRNNLVNLLISQSAADDAKYEQRVRDDFTGFDTALDRYRAAEPAGDPDTIAALESNWNTYRNVVESTQIPNALAKRVTAYVQVRDTQTSPIIDKVNAGFAELGQAETKDA
ncbi:MCP four helix bundle domain-containing protein, partial [Actinoplanes siamensis]